MANENSGMLGALNGGLSAFPTWRAALEKRVELQLRLTEINSRVSKLNARISASAENDPVKKRAQKLLAEGVLPSKTDIEDLRIDIADLLSERPVVEEALRLQAREQAAIRSDLSQQLCEEATPIYGEIVARLATTLIELGKILDEERSFRHDLEDRDIEWISRIRPMPISSLGDPHDGFSRIAAFLQECIEYDFIEETVVPKDWRNRWSK